MVSIASPLPIASRPFRANRFHVVPGLKPWAKSSSPLRGQNSHNLTFPKAPPHTMSLLLETQISADADTRKKSEPGPIRPTEAAHIITSDAEAIEIAERLAEKFSPGASDRDHFRRWP